jgi:hypothetical protein
MKLPAADRLERALTEERKAEEERDEAIAKEVNDR